MKKNNATLDELIQFIQEFKETSDSLAAEYKEKGNKLLQQFFTTQAETERNYVLLLKGEPTKEPVTLDDILEYLNGFYYVYRDTPKNYPADEKERYQQREREVNNYIGLVKKIKKEQKETK